LVLAAVEPPEKRRETAKVVKMRRRSFQYVRPTFLPPAKAEARPFSAA
jgi:hypothetical protein